MISVTTQGSLSKYLSVELITCRSTLEKNASITFDRNPNIVAKYSSNGHDIVIKLFGWRSRVHYYLSPFMHSRAQISWNIAHSLLKAGVRTPKPIFVHTNRNYGFIKTNVFITEYIDSNDTLRSYLKSEYNLEDGKRLMRDLGINLAKMHEQSIFHHDLTTGNILVDEYQRTYLIDLNRAKKRNPKLRRRLNDLAKLYFGEKRDTKSIELRKTFFNSYMNQSGINIDCERNYFIYRTRLTNYRRRRKQIKSFFKGK